MKRRLAAFGVPIDSRPVRRAEIVRDTKETSIAVSVDLDRDSPRQGRDRHSLLRSHARPGSRTRRIQPRAELRRRPRDRRAPQRRGLRDRFWRRSVAGARRAARHRPVWFRAADGRGRGAGADRPVGPPFRAVRRLIHREPYRRLSDRDDRSTSSARSRTASAPRSTCGSRARTTITRPRPASRRSAARFARRSVARAIRDACRAPKGVL